MKIAVARLGWSLAVVFFAALCAQPARADQAVGVARISVMHGNVTIQRGDSGDSVAAALNAPLTVGDYLSTNGGARTEVQLDNLNFIRVASDTQLRFTRLDPTDHELQLAAGTIELRVLRYNDANPQVDTPSVTLRPAEAGAYRITVDNNGDTVATVRSGRLDLITPQGTQTVDSDTSVLVQGSASSPRINSTATVASDDFDSWNNERDQYAQTALDDAQYANSGIVGLDDLNAYGRWEWDSDYGRVWVPDDQAADWAPYHDGRWAWEPDYGWTWVGYEPWGWAPYHYGRWFYSAPYGWAWYPGPAYIAPVWQPALVAFFTFGHSFSVSIGFGNIGWVPLAPFEPYYPWWGRGLAYSPTIINNNITNITYNITNVNIYKNCNQPNALAIVGRHEFENGNRYHYQPVDRHELEKVAVLHSAVPIVPGHEALRFNDQTPAKVAWSPRFERLPSVKPIASFQGERQAMQGIVERKPAIELRQGSVTPQTQTRQLELQARQPGHVGPLAPGSSKVNPGFVSGDQSSPWNRFAVGRGTQAANRPTVQVRREQDAVTAGAPTRQVDRGSPWQRFNGGQPSQPPTSGYGNKAMTHTTPRMERLPVESGGSTKPVSPWDRFGGSFSGQAHSTALRSNGDTTIYRHPYGSSTTPRNQRYQFNQSTNDGWSPSYHRYGTNAPQSRGSWSTPYRGGMGPSSRLPSGRVYPMAPQRQSQPARQAPNQKSRDHHH